jgi:hypothetical protein
MNLGQKEEQKIEENKNTDENINRNKKEEHILMEEEEEILEDSICSVCLEELAIPTALIPCMHTFCKKCID